MIDIIDASQNKSIVLSDDTQINNVDDAIRYMDMAEEQISNSILDFEEEYDLRQCMAEVEEYLANILPVEATKMIEMAKGKISSNYSLRTSFSRILQWMSNYCPDSISALPDYE
jgi:hypothetical protein